MTVADAPCDEPELAAGGFSAWLTEVQGAIRGERVAEVPCGGCTACCTSSQFIHIAPDETDTLAHIPAALLFPAPRRPLGHVLMGYDERGHCPMLVDGSCSIYEHRPRTCRSYDCRIFPAAGLDVDEDKPLIGRQAVRWRFTEPTEADRAQHDAVQAAARFLDGHRSLIPDGLAPTSTTQLAVLAIEVHQAFLGRGGGSGEATIVEPDATAVRVALRRRTAPPSGTS